ncbi:MAG: polysaccharide biosynthesis/export family protein [Cyanobacteria bacterium J06554_11]
MPPLYCGLNTRKFVIYLFGVFLGSAGIVSVAGRVAAQPIQSDNAQPTELPELPRITTPTETDGLPTLPTTEAETPPPLPPGETAYTLGAGDVVNIDIFRVPQYSGQSEVLVDGTLNLPLIGSVNVAGLTVEAATERLASRYSQYLRRPLITLSILNRRPLQVGISGEIRRPGSYTLTQTGTQVPRLTQLLETSGGISQSANIRQVQIERLGPDGIPQVYAVDLWQLLETGNSQYDISLRDGDSIYIPTARNSLVESALLADASFAADTSQPINIVVVGEVYRPGPYSLQGGVARTGDAGATSISGGATPTTVTTALQVAGGIRPRADIRQVQIVRPTRSGVSQIIEVDLWQLLEAGDAYQDTVLQAGDTVFVPVATEIDPSEIPTVASASFSPDSIRINIVGEVERPGVIELAPNTALSQAILAAGGFNARANEIEAELIRLNPDGTVTRETIPVDFAQAVNSANNPLLQNNDVVIVDPSAVARISDELGSVLNPIGQILQNVFSPLRFLDIF